MATRKRGTAKEAEETLDSKTIKTQERVEKAVDGFPIVGIGASAGGLAAFEAFFSGMPSDTEPQPTGGTQ